MILQLQSWTGANKPPMQKIVRYETFHTASELDGFSVEYMLKPIKQTSGAERLNSKPTF
jgi:hypothetical protein